MTDGNIQEDSLIAWTYMESFFTEDYDVIDEIQSSTSEVELRRGLSMTNGVAIMALAREWNMSELDVIKVLRYNTLNNSTE